MKEKRFLLWSFYKLGYHVGDIKSLSFFCAFFFLFCKFSRIKKIFFLVRCNSTVSCISQNMDQKKNLCSVNYFYLVGELFFGQSQTKLEKKRDKIKLNQELLGEIQVF